MSVAFLLACLGGSPAQAHPASQERVPAPRERAAPTRSADAWLISPGFVLRSDRDSPGLVVWVGGASLEVQAPLGHGLGLRLDAVTPWWTYDGVGARGPLVGALLSKTVSLGRVAVDGALGPTAWTGGSRYWQGAYDHAVFPGLRVAMGSDWRATTFGGLRAEVGWSRTWTAPRLLSPHSSGLDARLTWAFTFDKDRT